MGKTDGCKSIPEKSCKTKVSEHILPDFSVSTISSFKDIENKHGIDRGKDCMKKVCESLREHAMVIINFKKKRNEIINRRTAEIIWKCRNLLYLQRNTNML